MRNLPSQGFETQTCTSSCMHTTVSPTGICELCTLHFKDLFWQHQRLGTSFGTDPLTFSACRTPENGQSLGGILGGSARLRGRRGDRNGEWKGAEPDVTRCKTSANSLRDQGKGAPQKSTKQHLAGHANTEYRTVAADHAWLRWGEERPVQTRASGLRLRWAFAPSLRPEGLRVYHGLPRSADDFKKALKEERPLALRQALGLQGDLQEDLGGAEGPGGREFGPGTEVQARKYHGFGQTENNGSKRSNTPLVGKPIEHHVPSWGVYFVQQLGKRMQEISQGRAKNCRNR